MKAHRTYERVVSDPGYLNYNLDGFPDCNYTATWVVLETSVFFWGVLMLRVPYCTREPLKLKS